MNCAIYARYSSDAQKKTSIADQVRECADFIHRKGWSFSENHVYADEAISGLETNRAAYQNLKRAALSNHFDAIVVDDLSRLGRDAVESLQVFRELRVLEVSIVAVADGIDTSLDSGKLPYYFKSFTNEFFLDELKAKITRGLKGQVTRGYSAGGKLFGYSTQPELIEGAGNDKFGRPRRHGVKTVIRPDEAKVVKRVFNLRRDGHGLRSIAKILNESGIPSPFAGKGTRTGSWTSSTIRSMLRQRKYIGDWTWNKSRSVKKTSFSKRASRPKSSEEWIKRFDDTLRIIPQDLWDAVQSTLKDDLGTNRLRSGPRGVYLLSGLLRCSECGSSYVGGKSGKNWAGYVCNGYRNRGTVFCSCNQRISCDEVDSHVTAGLQRLLVSRSVVDRLTTMVTQHMASKKTGQVENRALLSKKSRELKNAIESLVDYIEAGKSSESVSERLRQKERELTAVTQQLNSQPIEDISTRNFRPERVREWRQQ